MCSRIAAFTLLLHVVISAHAAELKLKPTFATEVDAPKAEVILPLLKAACGEGVRTTKRDGRKAFGCGDDMKEILASRNRPRRYPLSPYVLWEADGVLFGHFLSPTSEDAAINCHACETHPSLWGGTLLHTKKANGWEPVWYKAGIITRHCRRLSLSTGRQILFCEEVDGGMGHQVHGLYLIDFTAPKFAWDSLLLMANSYGSAMLGGVQLQSIEKVSFDEERRGRIVARAQVRHGGST